MAGMLRIIGGSPRRVAKWALLAVAGAWLCLTHSGNLRRVKTTWRQGDTLGCEISDNLPGA